MPNFLQSDDDMDDMDGNGLLAGTKRRARRQYDERKEMDDLEGVEDVSAACPWCGLPLRLGRRKYRLNN